MIISSGTITPCTNDSIQLSLSSFYSQYQWSTGDTNPSVWVSQTGYYYADIIDQFGCSHRSQQYQISSSFLQPPSICMVGVDTSGSRNRIIWERQNTTLIDSIVVFRETTIAGVYDRIGSSPYNQAGLFVDSFADPSIRAWRYKLAAVDSCGALSLYSPLHKTIHLTINAGLNGAWNLIWDGYQGFNFGSYFIYRGNGTTMSLLTQLPSTLNSFTDLNPPSGTVYYQIEILNPNGCYPDSMFAKANTNYNSSRSNVANSSALIPIYLTADFGTNVQTGAYPIQVEFTDATVGFPTSWKWHFGDGNASIEQNPTHTYNNSGLFTVSLIACNGDICDTMTKVDYINVLQSGLAEINQNIEVAIYPNPNDGMFTVDIKTYRNVPIAIGIEIVVYNLLGEKVYAEEIQSFKGNHKHNLNLSSLPKGIYNIVIMNDKFKRVGKVVIQ